MPVKIVDNFQVNINNPIDNRFVVGSQSVPSGGLYPTPFYSYKDDILYKYPGLRIWDFNDNIPYVWTGSTWSNENSTGASVQNSGGFQNYVTKFLDNTTVLTKSNIFDNISNVGIGVTQSILSSITINNTPGLHVAGNIQTNNGFYGDGSNINNIDANKIVSGFLDLDRISIQGTNPGIVYFLQHTSVNTTWVDSTTITVENSLQSQIVNDTTSNTIQYPIFVAGIGFNPIKVSDTNLQFKPSTGQLSIQNGTILNPAYSFINKNDTGMYYDGDISFSRNNIKTAAVIVGGIGVYDPVYPQIQFIETTANRNRLLWVNYADELIFRKNTSNATTDKRIWHQDNLSTLKSLGNQSVETNRNTNSVTLNVDGSLVQGIYTHNVYNTTITPSSQVHWSVISFGRGTDGSVQLASNWYGNNTQNGTVYADRDILLRSLRDTGEAWSPWVKIWNSGNSGYVPFGAIMMWSGQISQIPTGWKLCDGNNNTTITIPAGSVPGQPAMTQITIPDLRERFIVGAGGDNPNVDTFIYDSFTFTNPSISSFTTTPPTNSNGLYTRITTGTYYVDSAGKVQSGTLVNDYVNQYYVYAKTTGAQYYFIYDDRTGKENYILVLGSFPTVNTTISTSYEITSNYKKSVAQYNKNIRRIDLPGIIWPISFYSPGDLGGYNDIKLQVDQIPTHYHHKPNSAFKGFVAGGSNYGNDSTSSVGTDGGGNSELAIGNLGNNYDAGGDANELAIGGSLPHENRPPYYALAFIIYTGI